MTSANDSVDDGMTNADGRRIPVGMCVLLTFGAMLAMAMYGGLLYMCYRAWRRNGTVGPPPVDVGANELAAPILPRHALARRNPAAEDPDELVVDEVEFTELRS